MTGLIVDIKGKDIDAWEEKLGKAYRYWSEEEKVAFLVSMASIHISTLDAYVSHLQLGDLVQTPFGDKIAELQEIGFRIVTINHFKYVGMADRMGKEAIEAILFHPSGLLYYATSTQEGLSLGKATDIKRSELYFQVSAVKEDASEETFHLLNKGSGIKYSDETLFKSYSGIKNQEIEMLLNNCVFVEQWHPEVSFSLLNEADVYQQVNGRIVQKSDAEEIEKQMGKIDLFPEEIKTYLGYSNFQKRRK